MLDGRIDTQGTVKELRAQGVLDEIVTREAAVEVKKEKLAAVVDTVDAQTSGEQTEVKKPRKLVEVEHRGGLTPTFVSFTQVLQKLEV